MNEIHLFFFRRGSVAGPRIRHRVSSSGLDETRVFVSPVGGGHEIEFPRAGAMKLDVRSREVVLQGPDHSSPIKTRDENEVSTLSSSGLDETQYFVDPF